MIPHLETQILHYKGLRETGTQKQCKCERCGTWGQWRGYREEFLEGRQGHVRWVCADCLEVE